MCSVIGCKNLCETCLYGRTINENTYCNNKDSNFYNKDTIGLLLAPCYEKKQGEIELKCVVFE